MFMYILVAVLSVALIYDIFFMKSSKNKGWKVVDPTKKGGSFSLYFMDKHIANVRGKTKAMVLLNAIQGKDMTKDLDMTSVVVVKPVAKKVATKKIVTKKVATVKAPAKAMAKKVVAKKVATSKVAKKTSKK